MDILKKNNFVCIVLYYKRQDKKKFGKEELAKIETNKLE